MEGYEIKLGLGLRAKALAVTAFFLYAVGAVANAGGEILAAIP